MSNTRKLSGEIHHFDMRFSSDILICPGCYIMLVYIIWKRRWIIAFEKRFWAKTDAMYTVYECCWISYKGLNKEEKEKGDC